MPIFRTTKQILDGGIHFDENWLNVPQHILPIPKPDGFWDGKKEIQLEDVDFWEVLYEGGGGNGIYAAWQPYAEMYLIRRNGSFIECFSGVEANKQAEQFCIKHNIPYPFLPADKNA
jgi:hypothetical protein